MWASHSSEQVDLHPPQHFGGILTTVLWTFKKQQCDMLTAIIHYYYVKFNQTLGLAV